MIVFIEWPSFFYLHKFTHLHHLLAFTTLQIQFNALKGSVVVDEQQGVVMKAESCYCYHFRLEIWHFVSAVAVLGIEVGEEFAKDIEEGFRVTKGSVYL
jgi:hypothetical protein